MIDNILFQAISWTLVHSLWQGFFFALFAGIIIVTTRKSASSLRYSLLSVLFISFLMGIGITFYYELQQNSDTAIVLHLPLQNFEITAIAAKDISNNFSKTVHFLNANASIITIIWFLVFSVRCFGMLGNFSQIYRIRNYKTQQPSAYWNNRFSELCEQIKIKKSIILLESALVKVPSVTGFFKPMVLVPIGLLTNLSAAQTEAILLHELAHIRRKDYVINIIQSFAEIVFFFNPGVLWLSSLIREERENCCDDIAISTIENKTQFVQALVSFEEYNLSTNALSMGFGGPKNSLLKRAKRIVYNNNKSLNTFEKSFLSIGLFLTAIVLLAFSNLEEVKNIVSDKFPMTPLEIKKADYDAAKADHDAKKYDAAVKKADAESLKPTFKFDETNEKVPEGDSIYNVRTENDLKNSMCETSAKSETTRESIEISSESILKQEEIEAMTEGIIADLMAEKVIKSKNNLSYKLSKKSLIVNGSKQSDTVLEKLSGKYVTSNTISICYNYEINSTVCM